MTNPPTLLMIGNFIRRKGQPHSYARELADWLTRNDWRILTTSRFMNRPIRMVDIISTIVSKQSQYSVAHVDIYSYGAFRWAELACRTLHMLGKRIVLTLHGGRLPEFAAQQPTRVRRLLQSVAVVTAPSKYLAERMKPYRSEILVIPNAVDLGAYQGRIRSKCDPRIVWLRSLHQDYNPFMAVEAISQLIDFYPEIRLTMIGPDLGDGTLENLKGEVKRLKLESQVEIVGGIPKTEVPAWLARHDIFINTTNIDNTPVSVIEAMGTGLCVVSTEVGGIPYLLNHEENALLIPIGDTTALVQSIQRILSDAKLASQLSQAALEKAAEFNWSTIVARWIDLFGTLLLRVD